MKTRTRNLLLGALAGFLVAGDATESSGCTDFRIKAADGTVIIGGTMDFEVPVLSFVSMRRGCHSPCRRVAGSLTSRETSSAERGVAIIDDVIEETIVNRPPG